MLEFINEPWPWYIAGPLIGLVIPILLIAGNKSFGISSSLRHACAACAPSKIPFFNYNWKKEIWNLVFVLGILFGAFMATTYMTNTEPMQIHPELITELKGYGITDFNALVPVEIFSWETIFSLKGFLMIIVGGFLVGFGARYAGGCTSGHAIMGMSNLQWPSLIATISFMIAGFIMANFILPLILSL